MGGLEGRAALRGPGVSERPLSVACRAPRLHSSSCDPAGQVTRKWSLWVPLFSWLCLLQKGLELRPEASVLLYVHNILTVQYDAVIYTAHT